MLKKKNGFSFVEVLAATALFFYSLLIILPLHTSMQMEKAVLSEKRTAATMLSEKLQPFLKNGGMKTPASFDVTEKGTTFHFQFTESSDYLKGCVHWTNAKQSSEKICLFGMVEE